MGSATSRSVDSKSLHTVDFRGPRCTTDPSKLLGIRENKQNQQKTGNYLHDLDFDLVTLRSSGYAELVHTYL